MKKRSCPFCDTEKMEKRIFYKDKGKNWFAILAAPPHNKGHTILAAIPRNNVCPTEPCSQVFRGLSTALSEVIGVLKKFYKPKDILLASLRGSEPHFHFHLVPLRKDEEKTWRINEGYETGQLMQFLGYLEKLGDKRAKGERISNGWCEEQQRTKIVASQRITIKKLRHLSGYSPQTKMKAPPRTKLT